MDWMFPLCKTHLRNFISADVKFLKGVELGEAEQTFKSVVGNVECLNVAKLGVQRAEGCDAVVGEVNVGQLTQVLEVLDVLQVIATQVQEVNPWHHFLKNTHFSFLVWFSARTTSGAFHLSERHHRGEGVNGCFTP